MNTPPGVPGADSRKKLTRCADLPTHPMNAPVRMGDVVGDELSLHADDIDPIGHFAGRTTGVGGPPRPQSAANTA